MSLSAEPPAEALLRDEALLEEVRPGGPAGVRWYSVTAPAVVLGLGLRPRRGAVLDEARCQAAGVQILERRAGGGAVLLDRHMLCAAVCIRLPDPRVGPDLTESYRWVGERLAGALRRLGVRGARRVEVDQARADAQALKLGSSPLGQALRDACYAGLSPHEVVVGATEPPLARAGVAKIVGLAQVRRRHAALFQVGVLLRDQSALADLLRVPDMATRTGVRAALGERTIGLEDVLGGPVTAEAAWQALRATFDG